ncbi:hypothetical protein FM103_02825 [Corynebacterium xerosis]|nr:hypothetical protein FM103_02825 [Corynebacterium xerosis]
MLPATEPGRAGRPTWFCPRRTTRPETGWREADQAAAASTSSATSVTPGALRPVERVRHVSRVVCAPMSGMARITRGRGRGGAPAHVPRDPRRCPERTCVVGLLSLSQSPSRVLE